MWIANFGQKSHTSMMPDQTLANELRQLFNLFLAWDHNRKGRLERARNRLDAALSLISPLPRYLIAFDAILMVREDRHEEARRRFRMCLAILPKVMNSEDEYVSLFCRLWLSMYDADCSYDEIEQLRQKVASLDVGGLPKHFLRIPRKEALRAEFGQRGLREPSPEMKGSVTGAPTISYGAGFNVR